MESFAIHCTTCKARLRVTDASLVGQILSCPKCHSMVLVEPPSKVHGGVASPAAATAIATGMSSIILKAPVAPPPLAAAPPSLPSPPPLPLASGAGFQPVASQGIDRLEACPTARPPRDMWLFAGGAVAGVAIGAIVWLLISPTGPVSEPIAATTASAAAIEEKPKFLTSAELEVAAEVKVLKPVVEETPKPEIAKPPFDKAHGKQAEVKAATEAAVIDVEPAPVAEAPAVIESEQLLVVEQISPEPEPAPPAVTAPPVDELSNRLKARVLKGVSFPKVPLRQFVAFVADYASVKITIDADSLKVAGIISPIVTVRESEKPLDEVLQSVLEPHGLTYESRDGSIVIFAR